MKRNYETRWFPEGGDRWYFDTFRPLDDTCIAMITFGYDAMPTPARYSPAPALLQHPTPCATQHVDAERPRGQDD